MAKSKVLNKQTTDEAIAEFVTFLKTHGVPSFILLFQPVAGLTTSHLQEVRVKDALSMLISGFKETIKLDLDANPQAPKEYQAAMLELLQSFQQLIRDTNEKIKLIRDIPTA